MPYSIMEFIFVSHHLVEETGCFLRVDIGSSDALLNHILELFFLAAISDVVDAYGLHSISLKNLDCIDGGIHLRRC